MAMSNEYRLINLVGELFPDLTDIKITTEDYPAAAGMRYVILSFKDADGEPHAYRYEHYEMPLTNSTAQLMLHGVAFDFPRDSLLADYLWLPPNLTNFCND